MSAQNLPSFDAMEAALVEVWHYQLAEQKTLSNLHIDIKGLNQLVSQVDITSEKILVAAAQKCTSNCCFVSEENTAAGGNETEPWRWIIDPLDGTTNYLHGLPIFSISVAVQYLKQTVAAWVYCPALNQKFEAKIGLGSTLNGENITVSAIENLDKSLLATGFPYYTFDEMPAYLSTLENFMKNTHGLRRMGSAAIDLAYVAWGKFDGFFELNLSPWDVAAGVLLIEEAGGKVTAFTTEGDAVFGNTIAASNSLLHPAMLKTITTYFD